MTRFLPTVAILSVATLAGAMMTAPAAADAYISETVTLTYNANQLTSNAEAARVLSDLERQARTACMNVEPITKTQKIDRACVGNVLAQAIEGIDNAALTSAFQATDNFKTVAQAANTQFEG